MRLAHLVLAAVILVLSPITSFAQSSQSPGAVPRLINVGGVYRPADGQPLPATVAVALSVYADEAGTAPLWQETQTVTLDRNGRFAALLGATQADGIPPAVFQAPDTWLGMQFPGQGVVDPPRVRLTSVPYALNAETLAGRPASDYLLAPQPGSAEASTDSKAPADAPHDILPGIATSIAKYTDASNLGPSTIWESGGLVGIGTLVPYDLLHVKFTNTGGNMTGLAVQNLGNTTTSYSGMLFFDQNDALGQFQGFNNVTHEYRINNVARNGLAQYNGSINFMVGSTSRFFVGSNGNIGVGTTSPAAPLEVSNAVSGGPANMWMTSYTNAVGPYYMSRRSRGTFAAPTAVQNGDGLGGFYGEGYGATAFGSGFAGGMTVQAAQNWSDTAHGTALTFTTTPNNATAPLTRMTLDSLGNLGVGTTFGAAASLEVSNATSTAAFGNVLASSFTGINSGGSAFIGRKARGTAAVPTAAQSGDILVALLGQGYGATGFSATRGGMFVRAAENWSNTAQGTSLAFNTTAIGTITPATKMTIDAEGNVGIGTQLPEAPLEISRNGESTVIGTSYNDDDGSAIFFRRARGTLQTPAASQSGDSLGYFGAGGRGTTGWGDGAGAMAVIAAETWTDTANGTIVAFATTPVGTTDFVPQAAILSNGFVGLGTPGDANGIPTATDRLQVFGDVRVGTAGTDGCIKNFAGTGILGVCSSDRRFKKDITPFGSVLGAVTQLQPVHYYWRAGEFPDRHFGPARNYGLIAQDVEQVLPELVQTEADGFKAVDYSQLPLLTVQAIKELKEENDALKARVAELERLMTKALAAAGQR